MGRLADSENWRAPRAHSFNIYEVSGLQLRLILVKLQGNRAKLPGLSEPPTCRAPDHMSGPWCRAVFRGLSVSKVSKVLKFVTANFPFV